MSRSRFSISVRWSMAVVAAVAVMLGGFDAVFLQPIRAHQRWYQRVRADLESLAHRRPAEVSRDQWAYVVGWTLNAHGNCCSHPTFVDPGPTEPFADELERRLRGRVSLDTIDWIWDEFLSFSRIKSYSRYRPTTPDRLAEAVDGIWAGLDVE